MKCPIGRNSIVLRSETSLAKTRSNTILLCWELFFNYLYPSKSNVNESHFCLLMKKYSCAYYVRVSKKISITRAQFLFSKKIIRAKTLLLVFKTFFFLRCNKKCGIFIFNGRNKSSCKCFRSQLNSTRNKCQNVTYILLQKEKIWTKKRTHSEKKCFTLSSCFLLTSSYSHPFISRPSVKIMCRNGTLLPSIIYLPMITISEIEISPLQTKPKLYRSFMDHVRAHISQTMFWCLIKIRTGHNIFYVRNSKIAFRTIRNKMKTWKHFEDSYDCMNCMSIYNVWHRVHCHHVSSFHDANSRQQLRKWRQSFKQKLFISQIIANDRLAASPPSIAFLFWKTNVRSSDESAS